MAKTKAKKTSRLGRDSKPQYLGVKLFAGQKVNTGQIIIRQKGTKFIPGTNVKKGKDDTLYAVKPGVVQFKTIRKRNFDNTQRTAKVVDVVSEK